MTRQRFEGDEHALARFSDSCHGVKPVVFLCALRGPFGYAQGEL